MVFSPLIQEMLRAERADTADTAWLEQGVDMDIANFSRFVRVGNTVNVVR